MIRTSNSDGKVFNRYLQSEHSSLI